METRIEDLLEEKHFTEEEIYENIKDIHLPKELIDAYQIFKEERKENPTEEEISKGYVIYSKFNSLSQSEKEPYKKKEEEQLTRVIKQLDVIEKYLIPDYFYKCSNGKELYHQWCLKRAKKNKEDLTDASLLSELNYLSMEEEEINKWNKLNEQHQDKLKELQVKMKKNPFSFLPSIMKRELKMRIDPHNYLNLIKKIKTEQPDAFNKISDVFSQVKRKFYMNSLYYSISTLNKTINNYTPLFYYLENHPKECIGFTFQDNRKNKIDQFLKENKDDYEKVQHKNILIRRYCGYHRKYRQQIIYHTIITPKMLFYKKQLSDKKLLNVKDNNEKLKILREKWESLKEKEKKKYITLHRQSRKKSVKEWRVYLNKEYKKKKREKAKKTKKVRKEDNKNVESSDEETISNSVSDDENNLQSNKNNCPEDKRRFSPYNDK